MIDHHFMTGITLILKYSSASKLADGDGYADADRVTVINNSHSLIKLL